MKKLLFILLATYSLWADSLPSSLHTNIKAVKSTSIIELAKDVAKGHSGLVIHNYGNGLSAITHSIITLGGNKAKVLPYDAILHKNIPTINTDAVAKDKVIVGHFYDNVLLITTDATSYNKITKSFKRKWVHPDRFSVYFMSHDQTHLTLDNLGEFSKTNQIGLVLISTKNSLKILDPISRQFIGELPIKGNTKNAKTPFFARFDQMDTSIFDFSGTEYLPYFQSVEGLK